MWGPIESEFETIIFYAIRMRNNCAMSRVRFNRTTQSRRLNPTISRFPAGDYPSIAYASCVFFWLYYPTGFVLSCWFQPAGLGTSPIILLVLWSDTKSKQSLFLLSPAKGWTSLLGHPKNLAVNLVQSKLTGLNNLDAIHLIVPNSITVILSLDCIKQWPSLGRLKVVVCSSCYNLHSCHSFQLGQRFPNFVKTRNVWT